MNLLLEVFTTSINCSSNHLIYLSKEWKDFRYGPKSTKPVTINITWLTLICLRVSNNTGSYKLSGFLYFHYTCHHALLSQNLNSYQDLNLKVNFLLQVCKLQNIGKYRKNSIIKEKKERKLYTPSKTSRLNAKWNQNGSISNENQNNIIR